MQWHPDEAVQDLPSSGTMAWLLFKKDMHDRVEGESFACALLTDGSTQKPSIDLASEGASVNA